MHDGPDDTASGPRWLDAAEREAWHALVGVLLRLPSALDGQMQRDAGITHFEYVVMAALSESAHHTLRMSDLACLSTASLSRLSHVVKRLEERGWVRRAPCSHNGRYTEARLTDEGYAKVVASAPGHVETVRDLVIDALSPEQLTQLRDIGQTILNRIAAQDVFRK
ncbi:MarR family transcriptional regulator [Streptomyces lincolnensis]|uniref:MarR family winged helix-turn-helix transcriptional regulator n=1 Tax=Streptomyces lincolnensis TaxID=1915 RepID=UPI001E61FB82|nr:MarR family transcriptional regulator [Streptomyces lincolnensis]MCD7438652.1 MarR family transcriptional regulator [Streptomyces lincolnensis]